MIIIKNVENSQARYDIYKNSGDWWVDENGNLQILLAEVGDPLTDDDAFLLALHELLEAKFCANSNVAAEDVCDFDLNFTGTGEPGDAPNAPYRTQHRRAAIVEHLVAYFLGKTDYGRIE